ncbi:Ureidoglycolate hydrolase [Rhodophyticola sp. CCM32]|uniref:ureidoglycolate lyase n=1 Tax=Rhodophyticola sp. CCM32 TaxID=2916397 RepID=UPI00107F1F3E|nr:ureidoglycolate lyase [Rhodophyticola sp. CCM32]QBY00326.1 Ureidoglycolate hydrolase [Rhodophyticola sp. CCM32]
MSRLPQIAAMPLTASGFAPFGDVLESAGPPDMLINQGLCGRYHDRASLSFTEGRAGISLFRAEPQTLPYRLELLERHPLGSQAFLPMSEHPFLVTVAPDADGAPGLPCAFLTAPGQGINLAPNTWHGVLTPLHAPGLFAVIDRIGPGDNLQEHILTPPVLIVAPTRLVSSPIKP